MKIIYATDLHGKMAYYEKLLEAAKTFDVRVVVNGGDMLPHGPNLYKVQKNFIRGFLRPWLRRLRESGFVFAGMLGNDDIATMDSEFRAATDAESFHDIAGNCCVVDGYYFVGMNRVVDYPFTLKDRCREDVRGSGRCEVQFGQAVVSCGTGFKHLPDWDAHIQSLPCVADELRALPVPPKADKTVYVIHDPPHGTGLDMTHREQSVGSVAVKDFIMERQPLASFHGHIHESPLVTGIWKTPLGRSVCVQPGQGEQFVYVVADLAEKKFQRLVDGN